MHYRPQVYWQAGTQVTVDAKVYGLNLGDGMYGETDRTLNLTIGPAKTATVHDAAKIMTVTIDGHLARQFPVNMGRDESTTVPLRPLVGGRPGRPERLPRAHQHAT